MTPLERPVSGRERENINIALISEADLSPPLLSAQLILPLFHPSLGWELHESEKSPSFSVFPEVPPQIAAPASSLCAWTVAVEEKEKLDGGLRVDFLAFL